MDPTQSITLAAPREILAPHALPLSWRDPHTIPAADLVTAIARLERACVESPNSPEIRVCLGMAYAMNYDVYKSMDALQVAVDLAPDLFIAQMKKSELLYRLRALPKSEQETLKALNLATSAAEVALAKRQLQEIRRLMRDGTQKPEWTKSLWGPALVLVGLLALTPFLFGFWR
jgi:hypothetical protein